MSTPTAQAIAGDRSERPLAKAYWATVAGVVLLLWLAPAIPTQDGPIHLYNLALINDLLGDTPSRANFHRLEFEGYTNLGFIAVGLPLARVVPLWAVERIVLSLHIVMLALFAVRWLSGCNRSVFPTAWVALAFSLPWSLFMGFYGYQLGADLALLSVCGAWKLRDAAAHKLALFCLGAGAVVLFFHAVAAALFAGLVALIQLTGQDESAGRRSLRSAISGLPLLAIVLMVVSGSGENGRLEWRAVEYILLFLITFGTLTFSTQLLTCLLVCAGWAVLCLPSSQPRTQDHALRFAVAAGASLAALHLLAPDFVGGGGYLTGRFAWWIPLLMLPVLETGKALGGRLERAWIPATLAAIAIGSTAFSAAPSARVVAEVAKGAETRQVSGSLAGAIFDRTPKSDAMIQPLRHVASLFAQQRGTLITNYQARESFFPIRFTERAKARFPDVDINSAWLTDWGRLPITDLVAIEAQAADRALLEDHFESRWVDASGRVELWHRRQGIKSN
jgi:hypothetical protein